MWEPRNLTATCPAHSPLTACSSLGHTYLALLTALFGESSRRIERSERGEWGGRVEYDFIVVGAGSAGCVVANRLTAVNGWKVLLLEAGGEEPDVTLVPGLSTALLGSNIDWQYRTKADGKSCLGRPEQRCSWPRGKTMGGSSSINSMAYVRGNAYDYDTWAAMGNEGWSFDDVLPFFKKSEHNLNIEGLDHEYHGVNGPQFISRYPYVDDPSLMLTAAFNEAGVPLRDFNGESQLGAIQAQAFSKNGQRVSTNTGYIEPIRDKRKNLIVETNSEAVRILFDNNKRAHGVQYIRKNKLHTAYANKEIIISAGAINSPKLLMLSGVGPEKHLQQLEIPLVANLAVGENLHDHVTFNGIIIALPNKTSTSINPDEMFKQIILQKYSDLKRGPLSANGPVNSAAFIKSDPSLPAPDIQYQSNVVHLHDYIPQPAHYDTVRIFPTAFYDGLEPRTMNVAPKSRGKLYLNGSDPYGNPVMFTNYFGDPSDLIPLIKGVRFLISLENTEAFKSRGAHFVKTPLKGCTTYKWGSDAYIECLARTYTYTTYHPVGTCKMGPVRDKNAVVDPRLRVYGVAGLRVIDSSIMPVAPRGNTNAPSIMIGEKGVDFIIEDWLHNYHNIPK